MHDFQETGIALVSRHVDLAGEFQAADAGRADDDFTAALFGLRSGITWETVVEDHTAVIGIIDAVADVAIVPNVPQVAGGVVQVDSQPGAATRPGTVITAAGAADITKDRLREGDVLALARQFQIEIAVSRGNNRVRTGSAADAQVVGAADRCGEVLDVTIQRAGIGGAGANQATGGVVQLKDDVAGGIGIVARQRDRGGLMGLQAEAVPVHVVDRVVVELHLGMQGAVVVVIETRLAAGVTEIERIGKAEEQSGGTLGRSELLQRRAVQHAAVADVEGLAELRTETGEVGVVGEIEAIRGAARQVIAQEHASEEHGLAGLVAKDWIGGIVRP